MSKDLGLEVAGPVVTATLQRPDKRNALTEAMIDALIQAIGEAEATGARAFVIRSSGGCFSGGRDLTELSAMPRPAQEDGSARRLSSLEPLLEALEASQLPVIAVVQGDAIAGGVELALACDVVVASSEASFNMSLARLGLAPTITLCRRLVEALGPVVAMDLLMTAQPVTAQRLHGLGAIARCVDPETLDATAADVIDAIVSNGPLAISAVKQSIRGIVQDSTQLEHLQGLAEAVRYSADAEEGMRAWKERRAPVFLRK